MKRLQFRHHDEVFATRDAALEFFSNIVDINRVECLEFGESLYSEPLVVKYLDEENHTQVLFAIGVDSGHTAYHLIDSADIIKNVTANADAIAYEIGRAMAMEEALSAVTNDLQQQITENVSVIESVVPSSANVLEEFVLKNHEGQEMGEHIKIYKDNSLVAALLGYKDATGVYKDPETGEYVLTYTGQTTGEKDYLYLVYRDEEDQLQLVGINLEDFIYESEFADGLQVSGHVVSVKIDGLSEGFLTVSPNGIKLDGVQAAIDAAKAEAKEYALDLVEAEKAERKAVDNVLSGNVRDAIDECKTYTSSAYTLAMGHLNDEVTTLNEKIDNNFTSSTTYTDNALAEAKAYSDTLSANTYNAVERALDSAVTHADAINTALSGNLMNYTDNALETAKDYTDDLYITELPVQSGSTLVAKYQLQFGPDPLPGHHKGAIIEIPRGTSIKQITTGYSQDTVDVLTGDIIPGPQEGPKYILIVYQDTTGYYRMSRFAVTDILSNVIFGDGLKYDSDTGTVTIEIHDLEKYLHVDVDGIYTSGITEEIDTAYLNAVSWGSAYTDSQIATLRQHVDDVDYYLRLSISGNTARIDRQDEDILHLERDVAYLEGLVHDIPALSASTYELSGSVGSFSADTVENIERIDNLINELRRDVESADTAMSGVINTFSADTVNELTALKDRATSLEDRATALENRANAIELRLDWIDSGITVIRQQITDLQNSLTGSGLVQTLMAALSGTAQEIKVTSDNSTNKVVIGFTDDAIFGEE